MSPSILNRIITGYIPVIFLGQKCVLYDASSIVKYECDLYYAEMLEYFTSSGVLTQAEIHSILIEKNIWNSSYDDELILLDKQISAAESQLPKLKFKSVEKQNILLLIKQHKNRQNKLQSIKNLSYKNSAEYLAETERLKYHFFACLTCDNKRVWTSWDDFNETSGTEVLNTMNEFLGSQTITEADIRKIARTEPWRTMWRTAEKHGSLFGKAAIEMTDYQRALCSWSLVYDSAFQSYNPPTMEVINNDDEFDAWLNSRNSDSTSDGIKTGNAKIDSAHELGVFVDTIEDADKVYNLNDASTRKMLSSRNKMIQEKGQVAEHEFSDVQQDLRAAANKQMSQRKYG